MNLKDIKIWKLNALDIMIVLVIAVFAIICGFSKLNATNEGSVTVESNNVASKFTYSIQVYGLSETSTEMFKSGDEVFDKISGTSIGKIKGLEITQAKAYMDKDNGELVEAIIPGKIDVKLTIETDGAIKNGEYLANGLIRIMVGNFREIKTKYLMCSGTITSIEK
ncbi:MAG: DUF4330 domain-containing protein [Clostridia bacterium]|nr:DUF4330 domain-containing protein [Clostridia bacterium]